MSTSETIAALKLALSAIHYLEARQISLDNIAIRKQANGGKLDIDDLIALEAETAAARERALSA